MDRTHALVRIRSAVDNCEARSDVEVVVVIAGQSGPYEDVPLLTGIMAAATGLVAMIGAPVVFNPWLLVPDCALLMALGLHVPRLWPRCRIWLTRESRRRRQVTVAADLAFLRQGVSLTRRRTGLLVYVSELERDGRLVADVGVRAAVPGGVVARLEHEFRASLASPDGPLEGVATFLEGMAPTLERLVPAVDQNPDELPNAPLVVPEVESWS